MRLGLIGLVVACIGATIASSHANAAPISRADLTALCIEAEDVAHCGRLVEAHQLKAVPRIAERNGDELRVSLVPFGHSVFRDSMDVRGMRSYATWDYVEDLDTVVLFMTYADHQSFVLVQRRTGAEYVVPAEPVFSPDRRRFVTADVCPRDCDNEVAVWRIDAKGVVKEALWTPPADWSDAAATWRGSGAIVLEFSSLDGRTSQTIERRLADRTWRKPPTN